jgi:hypothetical protein
MSSLQKAAAQARRRSSGTTKIETSYVIGGGHHDVNPVNQPNSTTTTTTTQHGQITANEQQQQQWSHNVHQQLSQHFTISSPHPQRQPAHHQQQEHGHAVPDLDMDDRVEDNCGDDSYIMIEEDIHNLHTTTSPTINDHHHHHHDHYHHDHHHPHHPTHPPDSSSSTTTITQTSYVIGGNNSNTTNNDLLTNARSLNIHTVHNYDVDVQHVQRMEGVEDMGMKMPLLVIDGANVAHHYAQAMSGLQNSSLTVAQHGKPEPDVQGIKVATDYFLLGGVRVLVVLPQYWFRTKPRPGDVMGTNATMETPQIEILNDLKARGLIVSSPPTDDDDAYALTIARKEETRSLSKRNGEGPGFVLSNDLFRDAQGRDHSGTLKDWLNNGRHDSVGSGRISYTFGDMGTMDDRGERILDFIPNPRHPLVIWMEG